MKKTRIYIVSLNTILQKDKYVNQMVIPRYITFDFAKAHDMRRKLQKEESQYANIFEVTNHEYTYDSELKNNLTIFVIREWGHQASYIYGIYDSKEEANNVYNSDPAVNYINKYVVYQLKTDILYDIPNCMKAT